MTAPVIEAPAACAACRTVICSDDLEPVPTSKTGEVRCKDETACRKRYTPRKLSYSVRGPRGEAR